MVRKWNKTAGLVSSRDLEHLRSRHLDDSLALLEHLGCAQSLLDVGSGGGFPGLPLALANPDIKTTLVERNHKKCSFLRHVVMTLKLSHVHVINADIRDIAEELSQFDAISARAVASPDQIWTWCCGMLTERGRLLLQSATLYDGVLRDAVVESHRSSGIGWINVVRRSAS